MTPTTTSPKPHPAKFSQSVLDVLGPQLAPYDNVLDPLGGVGRIQEVCPQAVVNEIEHEWAVQCPGRAVVADAMTLPFADNTFEAIVTSPAYGNRMADHHNARDGSRRITYKHYLGRDLHPHNTGRMQVGQEYWQFHLKIWAECIRVLKPWGVFYLNVSDHVRKGRVVPVAMGHWAMLTTLGLTNTREWDVATPRLRFGQNHEARVAGEKIFRFANVRVSL